MTQMRNLELSRIGIKKCVVLRILKIKKKELRDAGIIPTEKLEPLTLKNS